MIGKRFPTIKFLKKSVMVEKVLFIKPRILTEGGETVESYIF